MVSIVLTAYNDSKRLITALESALNQTHKDIEIVAVDDCSTDNTLKVLKRYAKKDARIKVYQTDENGGCGYARNWGIEKAMGEFICFLDSDDILMPKHVEVLLEAAQKYDAEVVKIRFKEVPTTKAVKPIPQDIIYEYGDENVMTCTPAFQDALWKSSLIKSVPYCTWRAADDCDTYRKVLAKSKRTVRLSDDCGVWYNYTVRADSVCHSRMNNDTMIVYNMAAILDNFNWANTHEEWEPYTRAKKMLENWTILCSLEFGRKYQLYKDAYDKIIAEEFPDLLNQINLTKQKKQKWQQ